MAANESKNDIQIGLIKKDMSEMEMPVLITSKFKETRGQLKRNKMIKLPTTGALSSQEIKTQVNNSSLQTASS